MTSDGLEKSNYSVLMSVYAKERAVYFRAAMESMWQQTIRTDDFVLVCDGALTDELDAVIIEMQAQYPNELHVLRLEQCQGLGNALNLGLLKCRHELVARMDSDDLSLPCRCEKELSILNAHPEISIVGSVVEEFTDDSDFPTSCRNVPETNAEIRAFSKRRNPFNHPSVMFRKSAVLAVGNYPNVRYAQDYYLWVELLMNHYQGYNIQEPLVRMRFNQNSTKRRSGKLYTNILRNLFKKMLKDGYITYPQYLASCAMRTASCVMPNRLRAFLYQRIFRKKRMERPRRDYDHDGEGKYELGANRQSKTESTPKN